MLKRVGHYIYQILKVQYFVDMVSVSFPINFMVKSHIYQSISIKIKLFLLNIDIPEKNCVGHYGSTILALLAQLLFFLLDMFIQVFMFFFDRFLIILGGEGGCLDRFFNRLLTRDPASEVCSVLR